MTMTRLTWLVGFLLGAAGVCGATAIRAVGCAPTVEAAIARLLAQEQATGETGYRVASVRIDHLRGHSWAMVVSCSAPASPMIAIELPGGVAMSDAIVLSHVRMGESVKIVRSGDGSRMELSGVAVESGAIGDSIHVRLPRFGDDAGDAAPVIMCRVVGPGVVEAVR